MPLTCKINQKMWSERFLNVVFKQADKEMIIPYNPASKATPPKVKRSKVNFFELDQLEQIQGEVDKLPIKWRTIIHLLMITGCRRLGHSRVSTTTDIYSYMLKESDEISAEQLADVMLRRKNIKVTTKAG